MTDDGPQWAPTAHDRDLIAAALKELHDSCKVVACTAIEHVLNKFPMLPETESVLLQLISAEIELRKDNGQKPAFEEYAARFNSRVPNLSALFPDRSLQTSRVDLSTLLSAQEGHTDLTKDAKQYPLGEFSHDRYQLKAQIGRGGFGTVFSGVDTLLLRDVAVKIPHRNSGFSRETLDEFLAEARLVASLDHPNILPVLDVGLLESGSVFIVSKLVRGKSLRDRLAAEDLPLTDCLEVLAQVADALDYAHAERLDPPRCQAGKHSCG